jgi:hypothetical protein
MMKRLIVAFVVGFLGMIILWLAIPWLANGGWPAAGPVGEPLPVHIRDVMPADGSVVEEISGFCVYLNYDAGKSLSRDSSEGMQFFLDGNNISRQLYDPVELEYRTSTGQTCYKRNEPLGTGWHTAKVVYKDRSGEPFEYTWRFQVLGEQ